MLRQAFLEVVREKGTMSVSVQEIADRANVSRGTFYAHYPDKYALIETVLREGFQQSLSALPLDSGWTLPNLQVLIEAVLAYFKEIYARHRTSPEIGPILERVIHEELNALLLSWLKAQKPRLRSDASVETIGEVVSWAIFGSELQWSCDHHKGSAEQKAWEILSVLTEGLTRFITDEQL